MSNKLTQLQQSVIERMYKADMPFIAGATQRAWEQGESYYIDTRVKCPKGLRKDFKEANKEAKNNAQ